MERIVIGAMARSGSTWAFNAAKLLAECAYPNATVMASDAQAYEYMDDVDFEIIKAHDCAAPWRLCDKIVTCVRDLRDAFCSAVAAQLLEVEMYNRCSLSQGVLDGIDLLFTQPSLAWGKVAGMFIRFERMTVDKIGTLQALGSYLFPSFTFTDAQLEDIAIQLEVMPHLYEEYDPSQGYLFGRNRHRQYIGIGGYRALLPYTDVQYIEEKFAAWFDHFGYPVGEAALAIEDKIYA